MSVTIYLIAGSTGAGKTTYALALAEKTGAIPFSIDDWMATLFEADKPESPDFAWYMDRIARVEEQMWALIERLAGLGVPAVLDLGFTSREDRAKARARAQRLGIDVELHFLDVDRDERWRRVDRRNRDRGETFRIAVSRADFDFVETLFEPPDAEELAQSNGRVIKADGQAP